MWKTSELPSDAVFRGARPAPGLGYFHQVGPDQPTQGAAGLTLAYPGAVSEEASRDSYGAIGGGEGEDSEDLGGGGGEPLEDGRQ